MKKHIIFEMETSDPDDFLTLLWLADHPDVNLLCVLITPGSYDQCQLVRWGLDQCQRQKTRIGTLHGCSWWESDDGKKQRVSNFHYKAYGDEIRSYKVNDIEGVWLGSRGDTCNLGEIERGYGLARCMLDSFDNVIYLVGSPPKNLATTFRWEPKLKLTRWVQQGGFAGDNLVAPEDRLEKFKGRLTCPSFNPGGAWKQTLELLEVPTIEERLFVSKNVCHGVVWDEIMQKMLKQRLRDLTCKFGSVSKDKLSTPPPDWETFVRPGLWMMVTGLDRYLADKGRAKAMHDLVAATVVLDESVCRWSPEVEIYREKGEWGARPKEGTRTRISVGFNLDRFVRVLTR